MSDFGIRHGLSQEEQVESKQATPTNQPTSYPTKPNQTRPNQTDSYQSNQLTNLEIERDTHKINTIIQSINLIFEKRAQAHCTQMIQIERMSKKYIFQL